MDQSSILEKLCYCLNLEPPIHLGASPRSIICWSKDKILQRSLVLKYSQNNMSWVKNEANILNQLSHPNIVNFVEAFDSPSGGFILVIEKVEGLPLIDFLTEEHEYFNEAQTKDFVIQILDALKYIHKKGFIHRDIKPDNLIYSENTGIVKLIDFEFCSPLWKYKFGPFKCNHKFKSGTLEYSAPEVLKGSGSGKKSDIWSLGVTIFVLLTGKFPFTQEQCENSWWNKKDWKVPEVESLSSEAKDFLRKALEINSKKRASVDLLINHSWLKH